MPVFSLKPLGCITVILIHLHHGGCIPCTGKGILQGASFQESFRYNAFQLQNLNDGGNTAVRLFSPQTDCFLKNFRRDFVFFSGFVSLWFQPFKTAFTVLLQISAKRAFGYAVILTDLLFHFRKRFAG